MDTSADRLRALLNGHTPETSEPLKLSLYCDGNHWNNEFSICDRKGRLIWADRFPVNERNSGKNTFSAELAAAMCAVILADRVRQAKGASRIAATVMSDAQWLVWANTVASGDKRGGKARKLGVLAQKLNVLLNVEYVPEAQNPAASYARAGVIRKWKEIDLRSLVSSH